MEGADRTDQRHPDRWPAMAVKPEPRRSLLPGPAPKGIHPVVATDVWGKPERGLGAQPMDTVVKHQVRITTPEDVGSELSARKESRLRESSRRRRLRNELELSGFGGWNTS